MLIRIALYLILALYVTLPATAQDYSAVERNGHAFADLKWWTPPAQQGNAKALVNMGFIYEKGIGVPKNLARAHSYYNLAFARSRGKVRKDAAERINKIMPKLTPELLKASSRFAGELWLIPPQIYLDQNDDGTFTISDLEQLGDIISEWLLWIFFLPGNYSIYLLISYIGAPGNLGNMGRFLEMSPTWYGGWISGIFSAVIWMIAYGVMLTIEDSYSKNALKLVRSLESFFSWIFGPIVRLFKKYRRAISLLFKLSLILLAVLAFIFLPFWVAIGSISIPALLGIFWLDARFMDRRIKRKYRRRPSKRDAE
jgi:hypothetical protein